MKLISWNIDSLNAALTGESPRALLSRAVIDTLVAQDADIIAIQETKLSATGPTKNTLKVLKATFQNMFTFGVHLLNLPVKGMQVPCSSTKKLKPNCHLP